MTLRLSAEQCQALAAHPGEPIELIDETSQARYVLLPGEQFDRIKALLTSDEFDVRETYAAQSAALAAAGWDDSLARYLQRLRREPPMKVSCRLAGVLYVARDGREERGTWLPAGKC